MLRRSPPYIKDAATTVLSGELLAQGIPVPDCGSPPNGALLTSVLILSSHQKH